jgi:hypothetical protein
VELSVLKPLQHASDGEVFRDEDGPGAEIDHLLDAGAYAGNHIGMYLSGISRLRAPSKEPEVVVVAADHVEGLAKETLGGS